MPQRFLVTGGAGYVGSHLVAALLDRGDTVTVIDNLRTGHRSAVPAGATLVVADLSDGPMIDSVLQGATWDAVFHFASLSQVGESMRMPMRYLLDNAGNGIRLIDSCVRHGVTKFVLSSTAALFNLGGADPIPEDAPIDPQSAYGDSKWMIERALRWAGQVHGLRAASLRYFNAAGADPAGRFGEDHRPESHLVPLVIDAALGRRGALDVFGNDSFFSIDPLDAIPRRCFLSRPLAKVEDACADQERCANEQEPGLGCDDRALHCYLNYAADSQESADPTLSSKVCSGHFFSA